MPAVEVTVDVKAVDFAAAAAYARFVFLCGYLVTTDPQRPTWNKGDFFGDLCAGK